MANDIPISLAVAIVEDRGYAVMFTGWEQGMILRQPKHVRKKRRFGLSWPNEKPEAARVMEDFFKTQAGQTLEFDWETPDGDSIIVRIVEDSFRVSIMSANSVQIELEIIEVF